ncbi:hypothetical protein F8M41_023525 [Gigaspora margarita]|uniref:Uncharacterized protein n=1 Tax=Gigaspora margarita TaxID=4874 RepID=A0A8H4AD96_GIGMA|nr:hypothetical protein F8M41_023525 [Gigaspora margarita]
MDSSEKFALNEALEKLDNAFQVAAKNLQLACLSLRNSCIDTSVTNREFKHFRNQILRYALVYRKEIFPLVKEVASEIQDFMENFTSSTFEDFRDEMNFLIEDVRRKKKIIAIALAFHIAIQTNFEGVKGDATSITKKLENEIHSPKKLLESTELLINSIQTFIGAFTNVAQSFITLENELQNITYGDRKRGEVYYEMCNNKAESIVYSCRNCISVIPICETYLDAIPLEDDGKYARFWRLEEDRKVGNNKTKWLNNFLNPK